MIRIYREYAVYSDGSMWYPEVSSYLGLKHLIHSPFEPSFLERTIEYLKIELNTLMITRYVISENRS